MTRAERWWLADTGDGTLGLGYPNSCNAGAAVACAAALYAAWRRRPAAAARGSG